MVKKESNSPSSTFPKDAQIVALLLKSLGVESCEPGVIPQLLEFVFRYSTDILKESAMYAEHSGRTDIHTEDARLAIQSKISNSFTSPPQRELASKKNSQPLPPIREGVGLRLPPERHCLLSLNYQLIAKKSQEEKSEPKIQTTQSNPFITNQISHGTLPSKVLPNEDDDYEMED